MQNDNSQIDPKPIEEIEDIDKRKADPSDTQKKNLFLRHPWIVTLIIAVVFSFFGLNVQKVWQFFATITHPRPENKTINYPLANENIVLNNQGQVHYTNGRDYNNFDKGGCGDFGFISMEDEDVILFPIPADFTYLDRGTVAFCVTPKRDFEKAGSFSLFRVHNEPKNISLKVTWRTDSIKGVKRPHLRMRFRWDDDKNSKVHSEEALNWKADGHYHIAGTWGPDGMKIYVDGEPVGENKGTTKAPKDFSEGKFVINNDNHDIGEGGGRPSQCIVSRLQISNYQMSQEEIKEIYHVLHPGK